MKLNYAKPTLRGDKLSPEDRAYVLREYSYRNTVENPHRRIANTKLPPIPDARWLEITDFQVRADGRLDRAVTECHTNHSEVPEWKVIIDNWAKTTAGRRMPGRSIL